MLSLAFAITCFMPNATFSYNPVSDYGTLRATFVEQDDSAAYAMCTELADRLYMVEIELATVYDAAQQAETSQLAVSENQYFVVGAALEVKVYAKTELAQQAALLTKQSNFNLRFLDMDASVKQTLAYFAVYSFNTADCFEESGIEISGGVLHSISKMRDCDYSHTRFGSSSSPRDSYVIAEFTYTGIGTLTLEIGYQFAAMLNNELDINLRCDKLGTQAALCTRIQQQLMNSALYRVTLTLRLQLNDPQEYDLILQTSAYFFRDRALVGCYAVHYTLDSARVLLQLNKSSQDSHCAINTNYRGVILQMALQQYADYTQGLYYYIETTLQSVNFNGMMLTLECRYQQDQEKCYTSLAYLLNRSETLARLRFTASYDSAADVVLSLIPTRQQYCFAGASASYALNENSDTNGIVTLTISTLEFSECTKRTAARSVLKLSIYKNTQKFFSGFSRPALQELSLRDYFSIKNQTIAFPFELSKKELTEIRAYIRNNQLIAFFQVDDIEVPLLAIEDRVVQFSYASIISVIVVGGVLLGVLSAAINSRWLFSRCRVRRASTKTMETVGMLPVSLDEKY